MIQLDGHAAASFEGRDADPDSRLRACRSRQARYRLGPGNGTLSVRTGRTGAAAKAGHDLLIHVTAWEATLEVGEDPAADEHRARRRTPRRCACVRAPGGMQALGDDDKANIQQTIDDEILKRQRDRVPLDRGASRRRRRG